MDQDLVDLCTEFVKKFPLDLEEGLLDGQEFFETVGEAELLNFFGKMYELFTP